MRCLILASGFGTQLYPLTPNKPKPLLDYEGKPLLTHLVAKIPETVDSSISTNRKFEADSHHCQMERGEQAAWGIDEHQGRDVSFRQHPFVGKRLNRYNKWLLILPISRGIPHIKRVYTQVTMIE